MSHRREHLVGFPTLLWSIYQSVETRLQPRQKKSNLEYAAIQTLQATEATRTVIWSKQ